jgi:hypothetical protein
LFVSIFLTIIGIFVILAVVWDGFETMVLPRRMYEPYVYALSRYLYLSLPPWISEADRKDDWQKSAWDRVRGVQKGEGRRGIKKDHF